MGESMQNTPARNISQKNAKDLINELHGALDAEMTRQFIVDTYVLSDGRVILVDFDEPRSGAALWESRQALDDTLAGMTYEPSHLLDGVFPYGVEFPDCVSSLVQETLSACDIRSPTWPDSYLSVLQLDRALRIALEHEPQWWNDEWVPRLIACTGQIYVVFRGAEWEMVLSDTSPNIWEPWLKTGGKREQVFSRIYDIWELEALRSAPQQIGPISLCCHIDFGARPGGDV